MRLSPIGIALLKGLEAHRNVAAVTAQGAAKPLAVIYVVVIEHETHAHAFERVEHFLHRSPEDVEESVGSGGAHVSLFDKSIALVIGACSRSEVRSIVEREHDHRLTTWWQAVARVHVDIGVISTCRADRENQRGQRRRDESFQEFGIHTGISTQLSNYCFGTSTSTPSVTCSRPRPSSTRSNVVTTRNDALLNLSMLVSTTRGGGRKIVPVRSTRACM